MKKLRLNIFPRILLATLLPLALIFCIMLLLVNHIIYSANDQFARKSIDFSSGEAVSTSNDTLREIFSLVEYACLNIPVSIAHHQADAEETLGWVRNLLSITPYAVGSWIVFEPGVNHNEKRQGIIFINKGDAGVVQKEIPEKLLNDSALSLWYHQPCGTGQPIYYTLDNYDYGEFVGKQYVGSYCQPIKYRDRIVAVAGIDIAYSKAFAFLDANERASGQRYFLLAENGLILYSSDPGFRDRNIGELGYPAEVLGNIRDAIARHRNLSFESFSPLLKTRALNQLNQVLPSHADAPLFLFSEISESLLYHEARAAASLIFGAGLVGLALLAASVFFATRNIVQPIKTLTARAERIANGQINSVLGDYLPRKVPRHEVDELEDSMMLMVEQLSHLHELGILALEAQFQRDSVEQASQAKDRFFANMSHEIRTPMNAILGMSELLLNEPLEPREEKYARDIKHASESLLGIINDVLDLSKLESGKLPLIETHYDFHSLLEQIASLCEYLAQNKGLAFSMELSPALPKYLFGDELRLRQVLLNIIGNAIKFTNDGLVSLEVKEDSKHLLFNVRDTGIGIKSEDIPLLFRPFQQLDDSDRHRAIRGTGLGLSISQNLASLMGGEISVESVPGLGSVFHIRVAKVIGDPDQVLDQAAALRPARYSDDSRALVVDDSTINLDVASGLLGLFNIACDKATSGQEGIAKLKTNSYDIVFMDHMMPEMDGVETVLKIRAMGGRFAEQVIVALTANAVIGTRELFLESGMNDFLSKPIVKANLQAILYKWMPVSKRVPVTIFGNPKPDLPRRRGLDGRELHTRVLLRHMPAHLETDVRRPEDRKAAPVGPGLPAGSAGSADRAGTPGQAAPAAIPGAALLARARQVEGLNVDEAMVNVAGDADLYLEVLGLVKDISLTIPANLTAFLEERNFHRFRVEAHGAKGSLRNLGADELANLAFELENMGTNEDYEGAKVVLPVFLEKFTRFARQVEDIFA